MSKKITIPPVPIGHLTIKQFDTLRKSIKKITGYEIVMCITDKKTKKVLGIV